MGEPVTRCRGRSRNSGTGYGHSRAVGICAAIVTRRQKQLGGEDLCGERADANRILGALTARHSLYSQVAAPVWKQAPGVSASVSSELKVRSNAHVHATPPLTAAICGVLLPPRDQHSTDLRPTRRSTSPTLVQASARFLTVRNLLNPLIGTVETDGANLYQQ